MRTWLIPVCLSVALLAAGPLVAQEAPATEADEWEDGYDWREPGIPAQRLAVLRLNYQGEYAAQLRDWVPALIESRLAEEGWAVLARGETLDAILREQQLPSVDPTTAPAPNRLYGATALLELTARAEVEEVDAAAHIGPFALGGLVTARFYLDGKIVDTETGQLYPLGPIRETRRRVRTLAVVFPQASWLGAGYNIRRIRETLMGSAADAAALRLVENLNRAAGLVPAREAAIPVEQDTIVLAFPEGMRPAPGAEYGIYRGDRMIAKVRVTEFREGRAVCRVLAATDQIRPTDVARPLEVVVPVQVQMQ